MRLTYSVRRIVASQYLVWLNLNTDGCTGNLPRFRLIEVVFDDAILMSVTFKYIPIRSGLSTDKLFLGSRI